MSSLLVALIAASLLLGSCADLGDDPPTSPQREGLFTPEVEQVILEVDYQAGAEPYTSYDGPRSGSPWELTEANLQRMFRDSGATLDIPKELDGMQEVTLSETGPYTGDELLSLADEHRDTASTDASRSFYILFVDGYFEDDTGRRDNVLGVSIGNTGVIAIFKPVVESTGSGVGLQATERFVEQTTIVHEFGHAAGLVNNGLPMTSDHHDEEHGAHCDNEDCVMYWQNEGPGGLTDFVRRYITDGDTVVFREDCLSDVDAAGSGG